MKGQTYRNLVTTLVLGIITVVTIIVLVFVATTPDNTLGAVPLPTNVVIAQGLQNTQSCVLPENCPTPTPAPTSTPVSPTPEPQATLTPTLTPEPTVTTAPPTPTPIPANPIVPKRLRIPTIGVDSFIEHVGLTGDGAMDTPKNFFNTAWYKLGARPGEVGNAVIAGHVDNPRGPSVFWDLKKLKPGNRFFVTDDDGTELEFEVYEAETYPFDNAPLDRIFGSSSGEINVNLITCTGTFDRSTQNYDKRLVVYARFVPKG
jgi:hypothetical protein